jgi:hypothetical protein
VWVGQDSAAEPQRRPQQPALEPVKQLKRVRFALDPLGDQHQIVWALDETGDARADRDELILVKVLPVQLG